MRDSSNDDGLNATIHPDGSAVLVVDETPHAISTTSAEDARREIVRLTAQIARQLDTPIRVIVTEPDGTWPLVVDRDENVEFAAAEGAARSFGTAPGLGEAPQPAPASADAGRSGSAAPARAASSPSDSAASSMPVPAPARSGSGGPVRGSATPRPAHDARVVRPERETFLTRTDDDGREDPATRGFRGAMTRMGIRMAPGADERSERADHMDVARHWPGPRTIAVVNGKGGSGKALEVNEPVLTATGYRPIGSLRVGDRVYGSDGELHNVLGVFPQGQRDLFTVTFSDGTTVLADGEHLWEVESVNDRGRGTDCAGPECDREAIAQGLCHPHYRQQARGSELKPLRRGDYPTSVGRTASGRRILTTAQLLDAGLSVDRGARGARHKFFVPTAAPVQFPETELPLDPYFVGLLLGDGSLSNPALAFTTADAELRDAAAELVPAGVQMRHKSRYDYRLIRTAASGPNPLRAKLEALGLFGLTSEHKFIPDAYRRASVDARLALLQGLLDTDGYSDGVSATLTSVSRQLIDDARFVAETLGCVVTGGSASRVTSYTHLGEVREGKPAWSIRITAPRGMQLFRLERKKLVAGQRAAYRAITNIEPAGPGEAVCISVDSEDHLFLTRGCVPTHNTPTTILLAAVFARFGGAGVLSWDNNQTRGTLGWRTEQGPHEATLHDMLGAADHLLSAEAQAADVANFVHHQRQDRFDVLRSQPIALASEQRVSAEDVDKIHAIAARYYRLIVMDSGNDESDPLWQRMIDRTDQLVVATTTRDEHAEAGALLLDALAERDERSAALARNAVAVVSQADQRSTSAEVRRIVDGYQQLTRDVVQIPFDPAMIDGHLHYGALRPATQRAWLAAAASVARGFQGA